MSMLLPSNFFYKQTQNATLAKSYKSVIQPANGTQGYSLGGKITLNIPTGLNLSANMLNSGLKFKYDLSAAAAQNFRWDSCGAHGLIDKIVIKHGGNEWDSHLTYGMAMKLLYDLQNSFGSNYGKNNILQGTRNDLVVVAAGTGSVVKQINSGEIIMQNNTASTSRTYFLNLGCILGALCGEQYFPLWAFGSTSITLEIYLVGSIVNAGACSSLTVTNATVGTSGMSNIEFILDAIELNSQAMDIVRNANTQNGRLTLNYTSYKYVPYVTTVSAPNQTITIPINCRVKDLKAIVACQRATTGTAGIFPYSSIKNGVSSYQFRVGTQLLPSSPCSTITEQFAELMKVFGSIGDINYTPNIEFDSYNLDLNTAFGAVDANNYYNTQNSGSYYIGIDMEQFSGADKSKLEAGLNSNTQDVYLNITYGNWVQTGAPNLNIGTPQWDIFYFYNQKLIAQNGTGYVEN